MPHNNSLAGHVRGHSTPPALPENTTEAVYFVAVNGQQSGPFNITTIVEMVQNRKVSDNDLIWTEGMANWEKIEANVDIQNVLSNTNASVPPPLPYSS